MRDLGGLQVESTKIDFKYLSRAVLARANEFLPTWLPGGKIIGHEYTCASINGGEGKSFKVNVGSGKWADFSAGQKGGDLISLYAAINNKTQYDAAKELSRDVGHRLPDPRIHLDKMPKATETVFMKPPKGSVRPSFVSGKFGEPTVTYTYRDESGDVLFYMCRYDPTGERKQFVPYSYTAAGKWVTKGWPAPRPLYGLDTLADNKKPVLIVEGEKACEAARQIVAGHYLVLSWPFGSNSWDKVDWSPIYGRKILIWPDADRAGHLAAAKIAAHLYSNVPEVKLLSVPETMFDGWDSADALAEGMDWPAMKIWAKGLASTFKIIADDTSIDPGGKGSNKRELMPRDEIPMPDLCDAPIVIDAAYREIDLGDGSGTVNNILVIDQESQLLDKPPPVNLVGVWSHCGLAITKNGTPILNVDNCLRLLEGVDELRDIVWYDEFHKKFFTNWGGPYRTWADHDTINLMVLLQGKYGLSRITKGCVEDAMISHAYSNVKNEPLDWFNSMVWDKVPRIDRLFSDHFGAEDTEYVKCTSKNMWLSMVARVMKPGCQVDNMVILEGKQGVFKSSSLRAIGGKYFGEADGQVGTKDFKLSLQGRMILEMGELDALTKGEITTVKRMLSTPTDFFRPPFKRLDEDFPRTCVFVGTTNDTDYLRDTTGARRFWPVRIEKCDITYVKKWREQMFAEAVHRVKSGEAWWTMPDEETLRQQEARRDVDPWEPIIEEWLVGRGPFKLGDVASFLEIDTDRFDGRQARRISRILRFLGWDNTPRREGNKTLRLWAKKDQKSEQTVEAVLRDGVTESVKKKVIKIYADDIFLS